MGGPKWFPKFKESLPSMEGKTVVITGTTSGTGKIAADTLASLGARLVLLNRKSERSKASLEELKKNHPDAEIEQIDCDLQSFASVKSAAQEVISKYGEGINVLANNAGIMAVPDKATEDGHCVQMQTNHLSHFLLTKLLMPLLEKGAEAHGEARVVNHSSIARKGKPLKAKYFGTNGGKLGGSEQAARWARYQQTKLANAVHTFALKDRLDAAGSKVKAVVAHPGIARTELFAGPGNGSVLGKAIKVRAEIWEKILNKV